MGGEVLRKLLGLEGRGRKVSDCFQIAILANGTFAASSCSDVSSSKKGSRHEPRTGQELEEAGFS
jgi:hypothetical protein